VSEAKIRGGSSAFPLSPADVYHGAVDGMTIREYLIAKFAAAMVAGSVGELRVGGPTAYANGPCNAVIADRACVLADVVIERSIE
jgi:hypothetical protein